jgi:gamma-carbonic anhydrase
MLVLDPQKISVRSYQGLDPKIHASVFLADGVRILGDVELSNQVSIWFNTVVRGDVNHISIGARSNIQDNCCLHVECGKFPLTLGEGVTVGHQVTLHGCTIAEFCLIGMGAVIMNGVHLGAESLVGAGTVIPEGLEIPPRSLILGTPGKVVRQLTETEVKNLHESAHRYVTYAQSYKTISVPLENFAAS